MRRIPHCTRAAVAALALAAGAAGPALAAELQIWKQPNFSGERLTLRAETTNLAGHGFLDQASSLVLDGAWELCTQPGFNGDCVTLGPGRYATLDPSLNHRVESVRPVAEPRASRGGRDRSDYAWRERRGAERGAVDLFPRTDFRGRPMRLEDDAYSLEGSRLERRVESLVVHEGTWQACTRPGFEGRCEVFEPGRYAWLERMSDRVASLRQIR